MQPDPDQLADAAAATGQVIDAIAVDRWELPTPCSDWTVRDLVQHVVAGNQRFADALGGATATATAAVGSSPAESDLVTAYRQSTAVLLEAFRRPGALEQMVTVPFGTVPAPVALHLRVIELLVHGWDIARATGQQGVFPAGLAEQELAFSRAALVDIPADRRPFAAAEPVAEDAPAIDRLVAQLGRKVDAVAA
ncbi:MAG: TIGR03086 family metal-binding protein [Mycobacteriaceae bacterium]